MLRSHELKKVYRYVSYPFNAVRPWFDLLVYIIKKSYLVHDSTQLFSRLSIGFAKLYTYHFLFQVWINTKSLFSFLVKVKNKTDSNNATI